MQLLMKVPKNKAGSDDGVLGEYVSAISPDQAGLLLFLLIDALLGRVELPRSWRRASVTLIPKLAGAVLANHYRPIMGLLVLQKLALRCWLSAASSFLELDSQASHVFRTGFQAAQLQALVRLIFDKRKQWGLPTFWRNWISPRLTKQCRGPQLTGSSSDARFLTFCAPPLRVSGGSTTFEITPGRGMPQGAPESPAIYACLMEELLKVATATLEANDLPAGITLPEDEEEVAPEDVDRLRRQDRILRPALHACNFADDAYLFASGCRQLSYMATVVGHTLSTAHQFLAPDKTEILVWPPSESTARVWQPDELAAFVQHDRRPTHMGTDSMKFSSAVTVLGSSVSIVDSTSVALSHRLRSAWKAYAGIRPQLQIHNQPIRLRLALLDAVVLPSLRSGLESLWLTLPDRSRVRAAQRTMVARCIRIFAGASEPREEFLRRRERVVTRWIRNACRGRWDEIQRYRCLNFYGHIVRPSDAHIVERALRWRGVRWGQRYSTTHRTKWGGQQGRRPADQGNSVLTEGRIQ